MPQNPLAATTAVKSGTQAPMQLDATGNLLIGNGSASSLGIAAATTKSVKLTPGRINKVIVTTAGSAPGAVYDSLAAGISAANLIATIPNTVGIYDLNWPCGTAITVVTGTGQVASVSYT